MFGFGGISKYFDIVGDLLKKEIKRRFIYNKKVNKLCIYYPSADYVGETVSVKPRPSVDTALSIKGGDNIIFERVPESSTLEINNNNEVYADNWATISAGSNNVLTTLTNATIRCASGCDINVGRYSVVKAGSDTKATITPHTDLSMISGEVRILHCPDYMDLPHEADSVLGLNITCEASLRLSTSEKLTIVKRARIICGDASVIEGHIEDSLIKCGDNSSVKAASGSIVIAGPGSEIHNIGDGSLFVINSTTWETTLAGRGESIGLPGYGEGKGFICNTRIKIDGKDYVFSPKEIIGLRRALNCPQLE